MGINGKEVINYMTSKGYEVLAINLVGVEGVADDGILNDDEPDRWNDTILVVTKEGKVLNEANATTEPGYYYTDHPLNVEGAARMSFGQYRKAYQFGYHNFNPNHPALVQVGEITITRDKNRDMKRSGDETFTGYFGINIHSTMNQYDPDSIQMWSAGCQVTRSWELHLKMLALVKDSRPDGLLNYTLIDGNALNDFCKARKQPLKV